MTAKKWTKQYNYAENFAIVAQLYGSKADCLELAKRATKNWLEQRDNLTVKGLLEELK